MNTRNSNAKHSRTHENNIEVTQTLSKMRKHILKGKCRPWRDPNPGPQSGSWRSYKLGYRQAPVTSLSSGEVYKFSVPYIHRLLCDLYIKKYPSTIKHWNYKKKSLGVSHKLFDKSQLSLSVLNCIFIFLDEYMRSAQVVPVAYFVSFLLSYFDTCALSMVVHHCYMQGLLF